MEAPVTPQAEAEPPYYLYESIKSLEEQSAAPEPPPEPALTPEEPAAPRRAWYRNVRLMVPAIAAGLVLTVFGSVIGDLQGKNHKLTETVAADTASIKSLTDKNNGLQSDVSTLSADKGRLQGQVNALQSSNSDLNSRNSDLASFGAKVTGLVGDLSQCLADKDSVISYWAAGTPAPDSFFHTMENECSLATNEAAGLKAAINNATDGTTS